MTFLVRNVRDARPGNDADPSNTRDVELAGNHADVDGNGGVLLPTLIDVGAQIPTDMCIKSELQSAWRSGIGEVLLAPIPDRPLDKPEVIRQLLQDCQHENAARLSPLGSVTRGMDGNSLSDMAALLDAGCLGFATGLRWISDARVMRCAMQYAAELGAPLFISPSDPNLVASGCAHDGRIAMRLGLPGIPRAAETTALARDLALVEEIGVRAHFGPLSCPQSVQMVVDARDRGLPVSADVAIYSLFFQDMDLVGFNANLHLLPPVRDEEDLNGLRRAVISGTISTRSHHTPLHRDAKLAPFPDNEPGASGFDTYLGLLVRLCAENDLPLTRVTQLAFSDSAMLSGGDGPTMLLDDGANGLVPDGLDWSSAGDNTPFRGWELTKKPLNVWA